MQNETNKNVTMERTIKLTANGKKHELVVRMDFNNVSRSQLLTWAFADRVIALQRVLRECSNETLSEFTENGLDVHALAAGQKPKSFNETKNDIKAHMATLSPEDRQKVINDIMDGNI